MVWEPDDSGSGVYHFSLPELRLLRTAKAMEATISEPGGAEPAAEPGVMVLQRKQLSTANRATDPIQLQSVFKRTIELK